MRLGDLDLLKEEIENNKWSWLRNADKGKVLYLIKRQPTINPEDLRPKGKWVEGNVIEKCSLCGKGGFRGMHYCPHCGAKMED